MLVRQRATPEHNMKRNTPDTLMVWTLTDEVIECPELLKRQFEEIRAKGFGGVATYVRCSRYTWNDHPARRAMAAIGGLCKRAGMAHWIGPDPRFVSRTLIARSEGLTVLLFGNRSRADVVPHLVPAIDGKFSVRCELSPRHVHTLNEVAIDYEPLGIIRVYAVRFAQGAAGVLDITRHAHFFYNARDRYVEAFGTLPDKSTEPYKVLAFFAARTNHVDYSNGEQIRHYIALLRDLKEMGCAADGVMWDEAGYTCTYGTLPYSPAMRKSYARQRGRPIEKELWKLALDAADGSHVRVRTTYYHVIQESLNRANRVTTDHIRGLWGKETVSGIHDTWHFESADMCDMNHGSLDLWAAAKTKTGGFVDLGGVDKLRDPDSPWYAHLAAMNAIAASLGKISDGGYAYNNLWTVGDDSGEGWQTAVLTHCADAMALFGLRWLAHAYGPVGTIGEERTFLGSPFLPGYPEHSTWPHFPEWNRKLSAHLDAVSHRLPQANLLILFPVETLYALADPRADAAAASVFRLILALLDAHYQVDVLSPSVCERGRWFGEKLVLGVQRYDAVLFPSPNALKPSLTRLLGSNSSRLLFVGGRPERRTDGRLLRHSSPAVARTLQDVSEWLAAIPGIRRIEAPEGCWATMTERASGTVVSLMPARLGRRFQGLVSLDGRTVAIPEQQGLIRVVFPKDDSAPTVTANSLSE
jgi:hypothetical protein